MGNVLNACLDFLKSTGVGQSIVGGEWKWIIMVIIACVLCYLAIVKKFEPLLLLPIAIGMLLTNLPGAGVFHEALFEGGHIHWEMFTDGSFTPGLIDILYLGVKLGIYPCLIFIGVGAMTDFGPLLANPKSLLLGAAAQIGIFATFAGVMGVGFLGDKLDWEPIKFIMEEAASIGIIGGADGPTAIFVTSKLAPQHWNSKLVIFSDIRNDEDIFNYICNSIFVARL